MPQDNASAPADSVTIRDQLGVVARRWRIIAAFTILGVLAAGLFIHRETKPYVSHAQVLVNPVSDNPFSSSRTSTTTSVAMPTEEKLATSVTVANSVAHSLNNGQSATELLNHLTVTVPATTQILDFAFSAGSAPAAQAGAQDFAKAYLSARHDRNAAAITAQEKTLTAQITSQSAKAQALAKEINPALPSSSGTNGELTNEIQQINQGINNDQQSLGVLQTIDPTSASVTQQATLPTKRSETSVKVVGAAGVLVGLILGLIAAFVADGLDDHLRGPADMYAAVGVPVLARIPLLRRLPWRRLDLASEGTSHPKIAEAYRHLASRLLVLGVGGSVTSVLVASPAEADGRSSVAANLAAVYVDLGYRVWLVSADLAPPQVHTLMAPAGPSSLVSVVPIASRDSVATSALERVSDTPDGQGHLTLMSGTGTTGSGRLLHPLHLGRQIVHNQQHVDITIIDAPPMLDFADAIPLIPVVDAVIVVADAATTKRDELVELVDLLQSSNANIIGGVLNRDGSRVVSRRARRARRRMERVLHPRSSKSQPGVTEPPAGSRPAPSAHQPDPSGSTATKQDFASSAPNGTAQPRSERRFNGWSPSEEPLSRD